MTFVFGTPSWPEIHPPIYPEAVEGLDAPWYHSRDAGGMEVAFGSHEGKKLNEIPLTGLFHKMEEEKRSQSGHPQYNEFLKCVGRWVRGLEKFAIDNYGEFIVPFGKHGGLKVDEIKQHRPDPQEWMWWFLGKTNDVKRHYIFTACVLRWLKRHGHVPSRGDRAGLFERTKKDLWSFVDKLSLHSGLEREEVYIVSIWVIKVDNTIFI